MLRALWFMLKVGALVAVVIWIAQRPGSVKLQWLDYGFTVHIGLFLLFVLALILCAIFAYNVVTGFVKLPSNLRRYKEIRHQEKGYEALTIGLTAVAAGDTRAAVKQAARAEKYLKDDTGLPLLLKAQSARLDGRESDALENFAALLENKNAAFLGVRGLLQAALDNQDYNKALELASHALKLHSRQPWIVKIVYDLHVRLRHWDEALSMLYRAEKTKALEGAKVRSDRVAIYIAQADAQEAQEAIKTLKNALKIDASFPPAVTRLARLYLNEGQRRKAVGVVKKAWAKKPHKDLVEMWMLLISARQAGEPLARLRWIEELIKVKSDCASGQIAAARAAVDEKLWGEARAHLMTALEIMPSVQVFELLADLEERSGQGQKAVSAWQEKAVHAAPDCAWICVETGRVYAQWSPISAPHGSFNTIEWVQPQGYIHGDVAQIDTHVGATKSVLDAPEN